MLLGCVIYYVVLRYKFVVNMGIANVGLVRVVIKIRILDMMR